MDLKGRVIIVPVGHFADRAKERPYLSNKSYKMAPEFTYLISQHHDPSADFFDKFRTVVEEVYAEFTQFGEVTVLGVEDYFNIFELMSVYRYICDQHQGDNVFINVGCGSKLTAMAGFMISGWYENVHCFYPKITITRPEISGPASIENKIENIQMIQSFPVRKLDEDLVPVLNFLKNTNKSKKEILDHLQEKDMISTHFKTNGGQKKKRSPQSLYNILKRNYIDPLNEEGLVQETVSGELELTDQGQNMQLIFGKRDFHFESI